jgi:hypothetical protein
MTGDAGAKDTHRQERRLPTHRQRSVPARIVPAPQLAHDVGDGNKLAARQRMGTRDFDGIPNIHDVDHAIDFAGSWRR